MPFLKSNFFEQHLQATERNNLECVSILLKHGADPHMADFTGNTALHYAVYNGNRAIASELLKYKVDINATTKVKTPIYTSSDPRIHFLHAKVQAFSLILLRVKYFFSKCVFHICGSGKEHIFSENWA